MTWRPYVIVSGGSGYLAQALCSWLDEEGYATVLLDQSPPSSDRVENWHRADVTNETMVAQVVNSIVHSRGSAPSGLVICHGWSPKGSDGYSIDDTSMDAEVFERTLSINLTGAFILLKSIVPLMAAAGSGRVVAVSSAAAHTGRTTGSAAYAASKAGMEAMIRTFAVAHAPSGLLFNTVAPGKISNPDWPDALGAVASYTKEIPLGRIADSNEIAEGIGFLISSRNTYITGQTIIIDGGRLA